MPQRDGCGSGFGTSGASTRWSDVERRSRSYADQGRLGRGYPSARPNQRGSWAHSPVARRLRGLRLEP
jgi:hypothetical protein